jgi:hypothetical protein
MNFYDQQQHEQLTIVVDRLPTKLFILMLLVMPTQQ